MAQGHLISKSSTKLKYRENQKCPLCPKEFPNLKCLQQHISKKSQNLCPVPECSYRTVTGSHLKQHMKRHGEDRPFVCAREGCGNILYFTIWVNFLKTFMMWSWQLTQKVCNSDWLEHEVTLCSYCNFSRMVHTVLKREVTNHRTLTNWKH